MMKQSTSTIVMVRPDHFGFNPQTAETNPFMHTPQDLHMDSKEVRERALAEFDAMVARLRKHDIEVLLLSSRTDTVTPDAVFPNNWFSHHADGPLVLYPMLTHNRRLERQCDALVEVLRSAQIEHPRIIDFASDEEKGLILESTGSMVLDRVHKVAFAMASARTNEEEFKKWCKEMDYEGVYIITPKYHRKEVYHTNLLMSIGTEFAIVCLEVIEDAAEQAHVKKKLEDLGKHVIEITLDQVYAFCGNVLEVQTKDGKKKLVMSNTTHKAFTKVQLDRLQKYAEIVVISIPTIEEVGGGGVRCMMAEVFPDSIH